MSALPAGGSGAALDHADYLAVHLDLDARPAERIRGAIDRHLRRHWRRLGSCWLGYWRGLRHRLGHLHVLYRLPEGGGPASSGPTPVPRPVGDTSPTSPPGSPAAGSRTSSGRASPSPMPRTSAAVSRAVCVPTNSTRVRVTSSAALPNGDLLVLDLHGQLVQLRRHRAAGLVRERLQVRFDDPLLPRFRLGALDVDGGSGDLLQHVECRALAAMTLWRRRVDPMTLATIFARSKSACSWIASSNICI